MLDTIKEKVNDKREKHEEKRRIKRIEKEKRIAEAELLKRQEQERLQAEELERIKKENDRIKAEYDRLLNLSEKELMVEAILAVRGFYEEHRILSYRQEELEENQESIWNSISNLEDEINLLRNQLSSMNLDEDETAL